MTENDTDKETTAKTTLRQTVRRFARDMTPEQVDAMLDELLAGWPMLGGSFDTLEKVTRVVSPNCMKPAAVVFWMHSTLLVQESRNGCELSLAAGLRAAARCGVTGALVETLRKLTVDVPPPGETH
jgi:hypothetical protein